MEGHNSFTQTDAKKLLIRQRDASDCGVACLASVLRYYRGEVSVGRLRELSGTTRQGTSLLGLYQAATSVGLTAEAFEADIDNLKSIKKPCILHVIKQKRLQHFIICYGYQNGHFLISDPADGVHRLTDDMLVEIWQSKTLLLLHNSENLVTNKEIRADKWKWITSLAREDIPILGLAVALGLFISVLSLSMAVFSQKLIDDFLPNQDELKLLVGLGLLMLLLFSRNGLSRIRTLFLIRQSRDFNNRMIHSFYDSLLRLPFTFFQSRKTGDLIARMNDTRRLQTTITYLIGDVLIDTLLIIVALLFILNYSVLLGCLLIGSIPVLFLLAWKYLATIQQGQKTVMQAYAENESNYVDTIQGIAAIKENNREDYFSAATKKIYGHFQDTIYDLGTVGIRFSFWAENVGVLFIIGVLAWGSMLVLNEELLLGALVAIIQMSGQMIPAVNRLALTNLQLQEAHVAFDRMFEFTSLPAEGLEEGNNETSLPALSKIEIEGLSFRFSGRSQLLKNITFTVNKGNITGLLGGNGSGKTTIIHLLRRFYESENGKIMVNNSIPWKEYSSRKWRNCIASVSQDCKIFNASLTENISLGKETWKSDRVIRFCNECGFEKYFLAFPQGYNTLLGEEGVNISGGQRQLVALARALYQKPELLLLDEATSGMDIEMEREVLQLLSVMKANMSIVLVTHRVQSAKYADYIYIIEKGIITDKGHPRDLLERDNLFSNALADFSLVS